MQLKPMEKMPNARLRLMAASCALLSAGAVRSPEARAAVADAAVADDWSVDSALAYYHEDGRIRAIEPVVDVAKVFANGQAISVNATFDALSGSSPNGALPSRLPQTFGSASGAASLKAYTTAPGQLPVDPNYHDSRVAVGGNWTIPVTRTNQLSVGAKVSDERDFFSLTVNASIAHDFNDKNTTLSFGINNEYDRLQPIGGTPLAGTDIAFSSKSGAKQSKDGIGLLLGVTQLMSRTWLSEFNISIDRFHGYLNDPYKITSVIDSSGNTTEYLYESRPQQRTRKSAYWENRVTWNPQLSTALSLRYMSDDWGIRSETAQLHLRRQLSDRERYIEPSIRWYRQTAADFYTPFILDTAVLPSLEASDTRLAAFHALSYGLKYLQKLPGVGSHAESEFSIRAEYYQQTLVERTPVPASLQGIDLYPGVKAILVQIGWRF
jgi:Protein of unknown function (DUF3570)